MKNKGGCAPKLMPDELEISAEEEAEEEKAEDFGEEEPIEQAEDANVQEPGGIFFPEIDLILARRIKKD